MKLDLEQIKADRAIADNQSIHGHTRYLAHMRAMDRTPNLEAALIEAVELLSGVDCGQEYDAAIRNFLSRFQCTPPTQP